MNWVLIIILSTGTIKKTKFHTEDTCQLVRKEVQALQSSKFALVKCVYDIKDGK